MSLPTKQQLILMAVSKIYALGGRITTSPPSLRLPNNLAFEAWLEMGEALELIRSLTAEEPDTRKPVRSTRRTKAKTRAAEPMRCQMTLEQMGALNNE
jgi:hypothetical protein